MENKVTFDLSNVITISFQEDVNDIHPDGFTNALFDFLGDYDIIQANELGVDCVVWDAKVYELTVNDIVSLSNGNEITLTSYVPLDEYKEENPEFYKWYHNQ